MRIRQVVLTYQDGCVYKAFIQGLFLVRTEGVEMRCRDVFKQNNICLAIMLLHHLKINLFMSPLCWLNCANGKTYWKHYLYSWPGPMKALYETTAIIWMDRFSDSGVGGHLEGVDGVVFPTCKICCVQSWYNQITGPFRMWACGKVGGG